jgi:CTP:molybdopterin cytidylyltransferase MocA
MGTQKLLLPLAGQSLISRVVGEVTAGGVGHLVVVVSTNATAIKQELSKQSVVFVTNPDPNSEMLSSVRCGLRALPKECEAAMIVLGDQPRINSTLVRDLVGKYRESGGIVVPAYRGRRGHPTLISSKYFDEVLTQFDDVGLHGLLKAYPDEVHELEIADPSTLDDIDHPEDYQRELNR